jgi:NitT/TauT family transport system substrate-binding protein
MLLRHRLSVSFVALLLVSGACVGTGSAQSTPAVRLATSPAETYAQAFYAQDLGFYQKAGVDVNVDTLATGAAVSTAVLNGADDIGVATMINLANAVTRGIPIVIIAPATMSTPAAPTGVLCVAKSSAYMTAKDFDGQTIAVPALKQTADLAARAWLSKGGLDPARAHIIEAPFTEMASSLANGTYAGAVISEPALTKTIKGGNVRCFPEAFAAIAPTFMLAAWFTTKAYADKNPDLVRKVAAALTQAGAWANAHQFDSAAIVARVNKIDVETIRGEIRPVYAEAIRLGDIQPQLDAGYKFGFLTRPVTAAELMKP